MKKLLSISFVLSLMLSCNSTQQSVTSKAATKQVVTPVTYAATITEEELKEMLYVYASDEFEGRETGEAGQKKAIEYLRKYYTDNDIPAAQPQSNYYQKVPLVVNKIPESSVVINGNTYTLGEHFATFSSPESGTVDYNEIIFAGYGVEDDSYSDYKNIDVAGKVVLIKGGEPKNEDGTYVISGTSTPSKWSDLRQAFGEKIQLARDKNAAGLLFYDDANFPLVIRQFDFMKNRSGRGMIRLKDNNNTNFFYMFINTEVANQIDKGIDMLSATKNIATQMRVTFKNTSEDISSDNVIAYIKGSEKPDEYVIISAHLDHVGVDRNGNVFNGADDNGSGTIAILEIAEAFKKAQAEGNGPKRSVVFLHVTGEEKGLLGSDYYTKNPIFPLENTVVDLNIDMIGRIDPERKGNRNYVYLIGSDKLSTELHNISETINSKYTNIELDYKYNDENDPSRFYYRSDHYNFAKNNIPIIFYFNGTHADYHKITDTPDKINYDLLANRAKLVFHTAWEIANRENRLVVDKAAK